jgi:hypothetical protein
LRQDNARIRWVNYGSSNSFIYTHKGKKTKIIEVNKNLLDYPNLFNQVILHEVKHSKDIWNKVDLINDIVPSVNKLQFFSFMIANPSSWIEGLPVYYTKKQGMVYDINMCLLWGFGLVLGIVAMFLLNK